MRQIGALVLDIGGHCISAIASKINCNRKFIKKCYMIVRDSLEINQIDVIVVEKELQALILNLNLISERLLKKNCMLILIFRQNSYSVV